MSTTLVAAIAIGAAAAFATSQLPLGDRGTHAAGHLAVGLPGIVLCIAAWRVWPPPGPHRISRAARAILVLGLGLLGGGQTLEALGAFGFEGNDRTSSLATVHDVALMIGTTGILITMFAAVSSLAVALLARYGKLESRWAAVAFALAGVAVAAFLVGGLVFGY